MREQYEEDEVLIFHNRCDGCVTNERDRDIRVTVGGVVKCHDFVTVSPVSCSRDS